MPVVAGTQYATQTDLAQLGLIGAALVNVSGTIQDAALSAASAIADSYLQSRYQLPLAAWGKDLVREVCAIASYDLLTARGYGAMEGADANIRQRYMDALAWLQEVSRGTQTPAQITDSSTGTSTGPATSTGVDGSISVDTQGGFGLTTSPVRGWTSRGGNGTTSGDPFWDKNF